MWAYTVPKVIDFPRYNTKCSGENEILRGIFHALSRFPLHFVIYLGSLDFFLDSVCLGLHSSGPIVLRYTSSSQAHSNVRKGGGVHVIKGRVSSKVEEGVTRCFFINSIWYLSKHVFFSTSRRYSARQHEES